MSYKKTLNFCPECGEKQIGNKFCSNCGYTLLNETSTSPSSWYSRNSSEKIELESDNSKTGIEDILLDKSGTSASDIKKPSQNSSSDGIYKWITLALPVLACYVQKPLILDGDPFEVFANIRNYLVATGFVIGVVLLIAKLTTSVVKGKSFWKIALIISVCFSFFLGLGLHRQF